MFCNLKLNSVIRGALSKKFEKPWFKVFLLKLEHLGIYLKCQKQG